MAKSTFQRLIDAGVEFTNITRKQAESIVKQMVKAGDVRKSDADKAVQELLSRGRETSDKWNETVQRELTRQVKGEVSRHGGASCAGTTPTTK